MSRRYTLLLILGVCFMGAFIVKAVIYRSFDTEARMFLLCSVLDFWYWEKFKKPC